MATPNHEACSRREAFRTTARWLSLGGLAALCGGLLHREPAADQGRACPLVGECRQCRAFSGCQLPRAVAARGRHAQDRRTDCPIRP